jgi:hypothetical protein
VWSLNVEHTPSFTHKHNDINYIFRWGFILIKLITDKDNFNSPVACTNNFQTSFRQHSWGIGSSFVDTRIKIYNQVYNKSTVVFFNFIYCITYCRSFDPLISLHPSVETDVSKLYMWHWLLLSLKHRFHSTPPTFLTLWLWMWIRKTCTRFKFFYFNFHA